MDIKMEIKQTKYNEKEDVFFLYLNKPNYVSATAPKTII